MEEENAVLHDQLADLKDERDRLVKNADKIEQRASYLISQVGKGNMFFELLTELEEIFDYATSR